MFLDTLEMRLKHEIPEEYHQDIEEQFARFETEFARMSKEDGKTGQATLTRREVQRAPTTNQHGDEGLTVIQLQAIKAVAIEYAVDDWLSHVDGSLNMEENMEIIESQADGEGWRYQ